MFNIIRRDPFRELSQMRSAMDRMFDDAFSDWGGDWSQPLSGVLPLDVVEKDNEFLVSASIPGINPDDLEITYTGNTLTIKGESKGEEEKEEGHYHLRERRYGSFARSITLPASVKADRIDASYEAGVLKLRLPKAEEAKPKRIPIKTSVPKMIEGKVREISGKK
jgi:HSP20 family protein